MEGTLDRFFVEEGFAPAPMADPLPVGNGVVPLSGVFPLNGELASGGGFDRSTEG